MSEKGRILADRYELKELIGQGGMADVYLAYDDILKREVAVNTSFFLDGRSYLYYAFPS